jgi:SAM-dependent methyltransferase
VEQAETFDSVAGLYDASRPGYPAALFATLAQAANLQAGDPVLEVGCGTGQATQGLRDLGLAVTALDPGANLIDQARRRFGDADDLTFVTAAFEDWDPPAGAFRLVASAQAWHWIPPEAAFAKAAAALAPRGVLAVFGHCPCDLPESLLEQLAPVFRRHGLPVPAAPAEAWYRPSGPVRDLFAASGRFEAAAHAVFPWIWRPRVDGYMAFLRSRSDVQLIPPQVREPWLTDLEALFRAALGDPLALDYETHLYWAARS